MVLGIVISVGLVLVSAVVNFRMAYRTADTEFDAWLYGLGAGLVDGLKALIPFSVRWAWLNRHWVAAGAGVAAFLVFSSFSFLNGLGYAADLRFLKVGERAAEIESRAGIQKELERLEKRRGAIATVRAPTAIEQSIGAVLARPVGKHSTVDSHSEGCTTSRSLTREACGEVAGLRVELAESRERTEIDGKLLVLRAKLSGLKGESAMSTAEPQVAVVKGLSGWVRDDLSSEDVRLGLVLVVGLVFEVASGLGLYLVTIPWQGQPRVADAGDEAPATQEMGQEENVLVEPMPDAVRIGDIDMFAEACLVPAEGGRLPSTAMFERYRAWCRERGDVPLRSGEFEVLLQELAADVGIPWENRGSNVVYHDVELRPE